MYHGYDHVLGIILCVCPEHDYGTVSEGRALFSHMLQSNCAVNNLCGTVCCRCVDDSTVSADSHFFQKKRSPSIVQDPPGHPAHGTSSLKVPVDRLRPRHRVCPVLVPWEDLQEYPDVLPVVRHESSVLKVEQAGHAAVFSCHDVSRMDVAVCEDSCLGAGEVMLDVLVWAPVLAVALQYEAPEGIVGVVLVLVQWVCRVPSQAALWVQGRTVDGRVEALLGRYVLGPWDLAQGHDDVPDVATGFVLLDVVEAGPHFFEGPARYLLHEDSSHARIVEIGLVHLRHWDAWRMLADVLHRSALAGPRVVALLHQHSFLESEEPRASLPTR